MYYIYTYYTSYFYTFKTYSRLTLKSLIINFEPSQVKPYFSYIKGGLLWLAIVAIARGRCDNIEIYVRDLTIKIYKDSHLSSSEIFN